jgi:hypothetical protein
VSCKANKAVAAVVVEMVVVVEQARREVKLPTLLLLVWMGQHDSRGCVLEGDAATASVVDKSDTTATVYCRGEHGLEIK